MSQAPRPQPPRNCPPGHAAASQRSPEANQGGPEKLDIKQATTFAQPPEVMNKLLTAPRARYAAPRRGNVRPAALAAPVSHHAMGHKEATAEPWRSRAPDKHAEARPALFAGKYQLLELSLIHI